MASPDLLLARASGRRADLRELESLASGVAPGGQIVVEYPTIATAGRVRPLAEFAKMSVAAFDDPAERVEILQHLIAHLLEHEAHALLHDPLVRETAERAATDARAAAELLEPSPPAVSFSTVDAVLRRCGFTHVTGLRPGDIWDGDLDPEVAAFIAAAPSPGLREHLRDLALGEMHRVDLFVHGDHRLTDAARARLLDEMEINALRPGGDELSDQLRSAVDALIGRVATVAEAFATFDDRDSVLRRLLAHGYVHPAVPADERAEAAERAARLQAAVREIGRDYGVPELADVIIHPLTGAVLHGGDSDAVD